MFDSQLYTFAIVAALLTVSPGADTMIVLKNVMRGGRKSGIIASAGVLSGLLIHMLFAAMGISIILMQSAEAFHIVKMLGAGYLIWLGIHSIYQAIKGNGLNLSEKKEAGIEYNFSRSFREGFVSNILNPKVAVFYLAFFPQFINKGDSVAVKSFVLASIHYIESIIWLLILSYAFGYIRKQIMNSKVIRWVNGIAGGLLVTLGAAIVLEDSK